MTMTTTTKLEGTNAEKILGGIHPFFGHPANHYPEPEESISKVKAILRTLMACQDETTCEFTIQPGDVAWNLLLVFDLVEEISSRLAMFQDNVSASWAEAGRRLNSCHIVMPVDIDTPALQRSGTDPGESRGEPR